MSDESSSGSGLLNKVALALGALYVIASLYLIFSLNDRLAKLELSQTTAAQKHEALSNRLKGSEEELKATSETLGEKLGMTQKELSSRTAELRRQQQAAEQRLASEQEKKFGEVSGQVAGVKTDVVEVKTDVATAKSELEATKAKLERAIGDLGMQSGLIARTREDLEWLKHRGDRNYFEFTLNKNQRVPVSTISLKLKKTDPKKGKFTLAVMADDREIEKKDRTVSEPLQFYTGRERQLFELVVLSVEKNKVTGYLSTPKTTPQPGS